MAVALVNEANGTASGSGGATATFTSATANNLLVMVMTARSSPVGTFTAPSGWTKAVDRHNATTSSPGVMIAYKVAAGGETSATGAYSVSADFGWWVGEYEGITASPLDVTASNDSAGGSVATLASGTTGTTAQDHEFAVAAWAVNSTSITGPSYSDNFTAEAFFDSSTALGGGHKVMVATKIVTTTGTVSSTASWTTAARPTGAVAVFKQSGTTVVPPFVGATNTTSGTSMAAPQSINLPAGITSGDLIIAQVANDAAATLTTSSTGWVKLGGNNNAAVSGAVFAKVATGSDSLSVTGGSAQDYAALTYLVTGHGVTSPSTDLTFAATSGTSSTPDPPNCNPGSSAKYLWLEGFVADDDDNTTTYWSTNFTGITQVESAQSTSSCMTSAAWLQSEVSSLDPGAMALAASEEWWAWTIAVPPDTGGSADVSATVIATTTTITTPTVGVGIEITKSPFATTTSLTTPSVGGGGGFVQGALSTTTVLPTATVTSGAGIDATLVSATTTLTTPTVAGGAAFSNSAVATTTALTTPSLGAGAGVSQSTLSATTTISTPSIAAGAAATPSTVSTTTALGEPTIGAGATFSSTTVDASTSFPSASLGGGAGFTQSTLTVTTTLNTPTITTTNNSPAEATPDTVAVTTTLTTPSVDGGAGVSQSTLSVTTTIATPTVAGSSNLTQTQLDVTTAIAEPQIDGGAGFSQATFEVSVTFPAPTVTVGAGVTPSTLVVTTSFDTPWVETPSEEEPYEMQPNRRRRGTRRPLRDRPAEP